MKKAFGFGMSEITVETPAGLAAHCLACGGTGLESPCPECHGEYDSRIVCDICRGEGGLQCQVCGGNGYTIMEGA